MTYIYVVHSTAELLKARVLESDRPKLILTLSFTKCVTLIMVLNSVKFPHLLNTL